MNYRKRLSFLCIAIVPILLWAQKPKQKSCYFYSWNFPEITTTSTKLGIIIDEKPLPTSVIINGPNGKETVEDNIITADTEISTFILDQLDLRTFELVPIQEADIFLELTPIAPSFILSTSKFTEGPLSAPIHRFSGNLEHISGIKVTIKQGENIVLFEETIKNRSDLLHIEELNGVPIPTPDIALKSIQDEFFANVPAYNSQARHIFINDTENKVIEVIQKTLDVRQDKERFFLYSFNKKKGFELEKIKESVESLEDLFDARKAEQNTNGLRALLTPKIEFWQAEASKYNPEDKKEKKIYWGLLANVSGAYYALGEYKKALEVAEKLKSVKYKEDYTYLYTLPEKKLKAQQTYLNEDGKPAKEYLNIDFRDTHNPDFIQYLNIGDQVTVQNAFRTYEAYKQKRAKAQFLYKILAINAYHKELKKLAKSFTDRGDERIGFAEKDPFFVSLVFRLGQETQELKLQDLQIFNEDEKILVTKITTNINKLFEPIIDELKVDNNYFIAKDSIVDKRTDKKVSSLFKKLEVLFDRQDVLLNRIANTEGRAREALTEDIKLLTDKVFVINSPILQKTPFLETLVDELTSEGKLSYADNEKLYKKIYKRFKSIYATVFFENNEFTKYMHHRERAKFKKILKFYEGIYKEDVENVNLKFKNVYNQDRALDMLMLFLK